MTSPDTITSAEIATHATGSKRKVSTVQDRRRLLQQVAKIQHDEGKTTRQACLSLGIDTSRFYKWRKTFNKPVAGRLNIIHPKPQPIKRRKIGPNRTGEESRRIVQQINEAKKREGKFLKELCDSFNFGLSQYYKWNKIVKKEARIAARKANAASALKEMRSNGSSVPAPQPQPPIIPIAAKFCCMCGMPQEEINRAIRRSLGVE